VTGWHPSPRARNLATAALLGLLAAILTGHAALVLLAAPALGALALMPRRRPPEPDVTVALSGARCFEGEEVTITATISVPGGRPLDEITAELVPAPRVALVSGAPGQENSAQTFLHEGRVTATWVVRPDRWGRYPPGAVLARAVLGGAQVLIRAEPDPLEVFPRPARMRPRLVPAELLRRIGEHTGRAVGAGTEFAGLRPYQPRDVNRAVSIRRGRLHVNQRAATRAADLVIMIDAFGPAGGPVVGRARQRPRPAPPPPTHLPVPLYLPSPGGPLMNRRPRVLSGAAAVLGLLTVAWPLAWAPAWTYLVAGLGALAVLAAVLTGWPRGPVLAVVAAVICCALSTAGAAVLAAEGLFILAYLLAAGAPPGLGRPAPWLRRQAVLLAAGLIAAGAVLAMDAVHLAASAWITVVGLAAAVAAYLVALPPRRAQTARPQTARPQTAEPQTSRPQTSRSSDASSRPGSV
jgi:Protein of unknown function DUF58